MRSAAHTLNVDFVSQRTIAVISPRLDDAVLSCGALLAACAEAGRKASVITVFNGRPQPPLSAEALRGSFVRNYDLLSVCVGSSRQLGADSPVSLRDMTSIIAQ